MGSSVQRQQRRRRIKKREKLKSVSGVIRGGSRGIEEENNEKGRMVHWSTKQMTGNKGECVCV